MLGNLDPEMLQNARKVLQDLKDSKLAFVAHKYGPEDDIFFHEAVFHLKQELGEFSAEKLANHHGRMLLELADMSNTIDMLAMSILNWEKAPHGKELTQY